MKIEVVRVWPKRALVYFADGAISFQVGYRLYPANDFLHLLPKDGVNLRRDVLDEIRNQIRNMIGESENETGTVC